MRAMLLALCAFLLPASAFAQAPAAPPTGKLPDQVAPVAYRIDFTIVPEKERFSGHTEIDVQLKQATASLYMHGRDLHVTSALVSEGGKDTPVTFKQVGPTGVAEVDFGRTLPAGRVTLKFDYDAAFGDGPSGLYRIKVADDWYSWTQFESIDARAAFPSFDEPGFKTPFTVSITTKPGFTVASNAPETSSAPSGDLVTHHFAPTLPLPTYLVALVTGPFVTAQTLVPPTPQRANPLPLRVIATKVHAGELAFATEQSGKIVALLENYFGQAFPYPKLDQIGSPVMPGAMENAGADIYGDGILFFGDNAIREQKQAFGMVVAHELSHQWFGDLVTPAWWDDIWLNESFANWMGYRIGNEWRPDLDIGTSAIDEAFDAMILDSLAAGRPIHQHIVNDADIDAAFDQITYGKGGQVVAMVAAYMGDEKFREGVRLHMKRHIYGNATTDEFFAALADAAKDPRVLEALRSFVDQQGVPVVTFHRQGNSYIASQSRYAYFGATASPEHWIIPFCVRRDDTRNCTLVDKPGTKIATNGSGVLVPNAGGRGYYRFDLDPADWHALIAASPKLTAGEALAVSDSLWASFYAGKIDVPELADLARAMSHHVSTLAALDNAARLRGLERRGLVTPEALPAYRKLVVNIYGPKLAELGFDPAAGAFASDDPDRQKLRSDLVGIVGGPGHDPAIRAKLLAALDAYIGGDTKALAPQYGQLAVAIAVQERGVPFAKAVAERALGATNRGMRQTAFLGIANSDNPEVARWFLNDFKDPRLSPIERLFTTSALMGMPNTSAIASDYMFANFDTFVKAGGGGGIFSGRAAQIFGVLCTAPEADALDAKLRPGMAKTGNTLNLDRSIEQIRNCARFREANAGKVSAGIMAVN